MENAKTLALDFQTLPRRGLTCCLLLAIIVLCACSAEAPEAALRTQLREMQDAAGQQRIGDFMQGVADDFTGNEGVDRAALHNMLRVQALARTEVGVATGPLEINVAGETATVKFNVLLTGSSGRLLPDSAQSYSITSGWRLDQGEWRVYYAQWRSNL